MGNVKHFLMIAVVVLVILAITYRVPQIRTFVIGQ
jgi:hypothetical protein